MPSCARLLPCLRPDPWWQLHYLVAFRGAAAIYWFLARVACSRARLIRAVCSPPPHPSPARSALILPTLVHQRRLTRRSSGPPTACHQARAAPWFIMHCAGLASHRRGPLSSNVRRQPNSLNGTRQSQTLFVCRPALGRFLATRPARGTNCTIWSPSVAGPQPAGPRTVRLQPGAADSRCLFSAFAPVASTVSAHSFHPRPPAPPNPSTRTSRRVKRFFAFGCSSLD